MSSRRALPVVWVCCLVVASADTLLEFNDAGCLAATASSQLPTAADWRQGRCVGPAARRERKADAIGEFSGKTWQTSFIMECRKSQAVRLKMYGTSGDCSGTHQEAFMNKKNVEKLFTGKCSAFKPKLLGAPEMYLKLQDFGSALAPCADDGQAAVVPDSYDSLSISADEVDITTEASAPPSPTTESPPRLRSKQRLPTTPASEPRPQEEVTTTKARPRPKAPPTSRTTLLVPALEGSATIVVKDTMGFAVGDVIIIDGHEQHQIVGFGSIILDTPLRHSYPPDVEIVRAPSMVAINYRAFVPTKAPPITQKAITEAPPVATTKEAPLVRSNHAPSVPQSDAAQTLNMLSSSAETIVQQARMNMINGVDHIDEGTHDNNHEEHDSGELAGPAIAGMHSSSQTDNNPSDSKDFPGLGSLKIDGQKPCAALSALLAKDSKSPIQVYTRELHSWLQKSDQQATIALIALVVGLIAVYDGFRFWHVLFTIAVTAAGAFVVHYEAEALPLSSNAFANEVLVAEAAVVIAFAMHVGFEGSQVLLGVLLGFWCAYELSHVAHQLDGFHDGFAVIWYTAGAFLGCLVFAAWRRAVLGVLAPLLGGLLCASAFGLIVSRNIHYLLDVQEKRDALEVSIANFFPPKDEAWIDALLVLLGKQPSATIALQCVFALLGALLHYILVAWVWRYPRAPGVLMVVLGIVMSLFTGTSQFDCEPLKGTCPEGTPWGWLLFGSILWAFIAGNCAYRQLELVEHNMSFRLPNYMKLDSYSERFFDPHRLAGLTAAPDVPMDNHRTVTATIVHPNLRPGEEPDPSQRERLLGLRPALQENDSMGVSLAKGAQGDRTKTDSTNMGTTSTSNSRYR